MPDLQKFIARFARTMIYCDAAGNPPTTVYAVEVRHLELLLDEVAKAAAQETVEAIQEEQEEEMPAALREAIDKDPTVNGMLKSGFSMQDIVGALAKEKSLLIDQVVRLEERKSPPLVIVRQKGSGPCTS